MPRPTSGRASWPRREPSPGVGGASSSKIRRSAFGANRKTFAAA
jgi:hypothetical protein